MEAKPVMFERFTEKAIKVIMLAQDESRRLGHNYVGTEQILIGLIGEGTGGAAKVLKSMGVNLKDAQVEVEKIIGRGSGFVASEIPFTPRAKRVLELSLEEALQLGHNYICTEHLLLGIHRDVESVSFRVLERLGLDLRVFRTLLIDYLPKADIQQPFVLDLTDIKSIDESVIETLLDFKNFTYKTSLDLFVIAESSLIDQASRQGMNKYIVFSRSVDEYFTHDNDVEKFRFDSGKFLSDVSVGAQNNIHEDSLIHGDIDDTVALNVVPNRSCDDATNAPELIISKIRSELWPGIQYSDDASMAIQFQYEGSSIYLVKFRLLVMASFARGRVTGLISLSRMMLERVEKYISTLLSLLDKGSGIQVRLDLPEQTVYNSDEWERIAIFIDLFGELLDSFPLTLQSFKGKPIIRDYCSPQDYDLLLKAQRRRKANVEEYRRTAAQRRRKANEEEYRRTAAQRRKREEREDSFFKFCCLLCALVVLYLFFLLIL